jgi:hypothetical protein
VTLHTSDSKIDEIKLIKVYLVFLYFSFEKISFFSNKRCHAQRFFLLREVTLSNDRILARVTRLGELPPIGQLVTLVSVLKITKLNPNFWLLFSTVPVMYKLGLMFDWATVWETFSHAHLVSMKLAMVKTTKINFFATSKMNLIFSDF